MKTGHRRWRLPLQTGRLRSRTRQRRMQSHQREATLECSNTQQGQLLPADAPRCRNAMHQPTALPMLFHVSPRLQPLACSQAAVMTI